MIFYPCEELVNVQIRASVIVLLPLCYMGCARVNPIQKASYSMQIAALYHEKKKYCAFLKKNLAGTG